MRALLLVLLLAAPRESVTLTLAPADHDRRYVLAESTVRLQPPFRLREKDSGAAVACQWEGSTVRWLVAAVPAGAKKSFVLESAAGEKPAAGMEFKEDAGGWISIKGPDREITRFHPVAGTANKKPCFYPLTGHGVNVLRGFPLEDRAGDEKDHPHHTGLFHAFGEVNGRNYWSKLPIAHKKFLTKEAGPVCARIVSEHHWGEDLVEVQDVSVLNAGADVVMDFRITLTAVNGPVVFGKDLKMAKEGSFSLRVGPELSRKGDAPEMMVDALGNKGEKAIRAAAAPWVDYNGDFAGKKVGVAVMNHPSSFRYPTTWHVRAYGLFAANPWLIKGENTLPKGESLALGYRVYVHAGDSAAGRVADVFAGYTSAKVTVE